MPENGLMATLLIFTDTIQYSHLFANWNVVYTEDQINDEMWKECEVKYCYEPIHILEKP